MEKEIKINFEVIPSYEKLNDIEKILFDKAKTIREQAYAPYSNFLVGCAVLLENGEIITGSNQENAAYPSGLCAERTTIFWTSANYPDVKIKKLFVIGAPKDALTSTPIPPCGACRQSILEYESKQKEEIEIYFASLDGEILKTKSIRDLLPFSFDASFL
ncbi:MAG: cytidine deaminase [Chryseobacterium sp. 36-9]|jgi:cytidine deaminase|uniref:Cytidine deaminase n=1 Tax=Epilithonimonas pallida TaxID=373671 RepID=A0ABY1R5G5_9FLAO|nr:cytidine deaminase [Epilithonimonas pallida]OJX30621.1 MAG: cytidine deaminase [Chryseobacterium sp. 36-9]SMP92842.1 cytidine deaminase [Epilithonimonas pallida]